MKTNTAPRNVSIAASESSTFSISNNAKIFRILIDGLYADKIQSITREIWSNALDAHVQAGCADRPFAVSFPNPFDPTFRVRDYGVSLSHDQVMHMYTDLGHSTKEDTNDAVGKFGIGSKSPFAYTDNFTVTVFLDGTVRFYSAMIGSDGVPAIHLMAEQPTEEENGVEVAFPVASDDTTAFQRAAKRVSHGFAVKPIVNNQEEFTGWPELPVLLEDEDADWKLLNGAIEGYSERAYVRMGPVLYPINANALGDITASQREVLDHTFVIDFDMGDLEITASREELAYGRNDPTTESILKKVDRIVDSLTAKCMEEFEKCESYFEACVKYREQVHSHQLPEPVRNLIRDTACWRGTPLTTEIEYKRFKRGWQAEVRNYDRLRHVTYRFNNQPDLTIPAKKGVVLMIEDETNPDHNNKRAAYRIREFYLSRDWVKTIVWVKLSSLQSDVVNLIDFFGLLDGAHVQMVHDLPMPERAPRGSGRGARNPVKARMLSFRGDFDRRIEMDAEAFEDGGLYVPLERNEPHVPVGCDSPSTLHPVLTALGATDQPLIGAPKSMWKKFEGEQWVNIYDFANEFFASQAYDFTGPVMRRRAIKRVLNNDVFNFYEDHVDLLKLGADSTAREVFDLMKRAREDTTEDMSRAQSLARCLGKPDGEDADVEDDMIGEMMDLMSRLDETYPMVGLFDNDSTFRRPSFVTNRDNFVDLLTGYVTMCDIVSETNHQAAIAA